MKKKMKREERAIMIMESVKYQSYTLGTVSAEKKVIGNIMLTRVEAAFRDMKSPLCERSLFHQIKRRAQTHIFLCVLTYHLLVSIEHMLRQAGDHRAWETVAAAGGEPDEGHFLNKLSFSPVFTL
jgi:hypothetical protein